MLNLEVFQQTIDKISGSICYPLASTPYTPYQYAKFEASSYSHSGDSLTGIKYKN